MNLSNMFGTPKEKAIQLHFRDDGRFKFRQQEIEDTFLVEKKDGEVVRGWKHFYKNQFPFGGYKNIPAGMVTLGYDRDIVLDPYNLVPEKDRPDNYQEGAGQGESPKKGIIPWLVQVGHARRQKLFANRGKAQNYDKLVYFMGTVAVLEILIIGILVISSRGG